MRLISLYLTGLIFGIGISISGMANPAKVLNFFDVAGTWDPSLIFVMGSALLVTFVGYRFVLAKPAPVMASGFSLPNTTKIDRSLILGAAAFGVGWGIAGFCPGGALPAIGTGEPAVFIFIAATLVGIFAAKFAIAILDGRRTAPVTP